MPCRRRGTESREKQVREVQEVRAAGIVVNAVTPDFSGSASSPQDLDAARTASDEGSVNSRVIVNSAATIRG